VNILPDHAQRIYPLPDCAAGDGRFTHELCGEVADLITSHGYPHIHAADFEALREALRGFLYGPEWCPGAPPDLLGECGRPGPHPPHTILTNRVTPLCDVDETGWCTTHVGFHPGSTR
jgi:hypothetical protein